MVLGNDIDTAINRHQYMIYSKCALGTLLDLYGFVLAANGASETASKYHAEELKTNCYGLFFRKL